MKQEEEEESFSMSSDSDDSPQRTLGSFQFSIDGKYSGISQDYSIGKIPTELISGENLVVDCRFSDALQAVRIDQFSVERSSRGSRAPIRDIKEAVEGCVCLYDLESKDMKDFLEIATQKGAVALVCAKDFSPSIQSSNLSIPIFAVNKKAFLKLTDYATPVVTFQMVPLTSDSTTEHSSDEEGTSQYCTTGSDSSFKDISGGESTRSGDASSPIDLSGKESPVNFSEGEKWYKVTVGSSSESFSFNVVAEDPLRPLVETGLGKMVLKAAVVRNEKTYHVTQLTHRSADRVLLYDSREISDIHRVQEFAAKQGAVALFVLVCPRLSNNVPLFVVEERTLEKMSKLELCTAKFENIDRKNASEIDHPLAPSYATVAAGRVSALTSSHPGADMMAFDDDAFDDNGMQNTHKRHATTNGLISAKKSKKGFIQKGLELLGFKESVFEPVKNRSHHEILRSFAFIRDKIDQTDQREKRHLMDEASKFLNENEASISHIAASAYLCDLSKVSYGYERLEIAVLEAITRFDVSCPEFRILERKLREPSDQKQLRSYLYIFLRERIYMFRGLEQLKVVKLLVFLSSCGLFRRKFDPDIWRSLRSVISSDLFNEKTRAVFASSSNETFVLIAELCFQKDLNDFANFCLGVEPGLLSQYKDLGSVFLLIIQESFASPNGLDVASGWDICATLLERVNFHDKNVFDKVASVFIPRAVYREIPELIECLENTYYQVKMKELIRNRLLDDLSRDRLDSVAMDFVLGSSFFSSFLFEPRIRWAALSFAARAASQWCSFEDKIELIDGFLKVYGQKDGTDYVRNEFQRQLLCAIKSHDNTTVPLGYLLHALAKKEDLFASGSSDGSYNIVTQSFVKPECAADILRQPRILERFAHTDDPEAKLFYRVVDRLGYEISNQCNDIVAATIFYNECNFYTDSRGACVIGEKVFILSFKKWNPSNLSHLEAKHKQTVDALFSGSEAEGALLKCKDQMRTLLAKAIDNFGQDIVDFDDLECMVLVADSNVWSSVEKKIDDCLHYPSGLRIREKCKEVADLELSIRNSLTISDNEDGSFSLKEIFREYNCTDDDIETLLNKYEPLFRDRHVNGVFLRDLRHDESLAANIATQAPQKMQLCAYFLKHPSLLFRGKVFRKDGMPHTFTSLCDHVALAESWLETILGPNSTFGGVCSARADMATIESSLCAEVESLLACSILRLSQDDTENFKLMSTLSELSGDLEHLIFCCDQFQFALVKSDISFDMLKEQTKRFFEGDKECLGVSECVIFAKSLVRHLSSSCPNSEDLSELGKTLVDMSRLLRLFSTISQFPDLYHYANEMEWFGEEGLKLFYNEYNNVTNVLLGDSETYEMSLLDSMEPAMRVISAIGSLQMKSPSLLSLLESCKCHDDITSGLQSGVENNIREIQSKLSEIKDWFSNGVDEIAAAHALFKAANDSGQYSIEAQEGENATEDGSHFLTLSFAVRNGDSVSVRKMQGKALDQFIQQLSLIQNENLTTAREMQHFTDQFQLLRNAVGIVSRMIYFGFEDAHASAFSCGAGTKYFDDAKEIMKISEANLRAFESWLIGTRSNSKQSLLFWTDELRKVYYLVQQVADDNTKTPLLFSMISRLQPLWNEEDGQEKQMENIQELAIDSVSPRGSWLLEVSRFLGDIDNRLGKPHQTDIDDTSTVVLHSYRCKDDEESPTVLKILHNIYKNRAPFPFEILDGALLRGKSNDYMELFLERTKAFPSFCFTVTNISLLESCLLEKLLCFLSDREIATLGITLHLVQRGETLHSTPWISEKSWDSTMLGSLESVESNRAWQLRVSEMVVVTSKCAGAGKTRWIRDQLPSRSPTTETHTVVVHQRTSAASLIRAIQQKFTRSRENNVLHVSFAFLPDKCGINDRWLQEINYFFFSFITLGSVYDIASATSLAISGRWRLFFELPGGCSSHVWLQKNIPIIFSYSSMCEPPCDFFIDDEARRVCTYLRAFSDGTINRKFESGAAKRVVLVLDCSGSMQGRPFADAVRNAAEIFDSHVVEGDMFGVVLFDNQVYTPIPIQIVGSDKRHLRTLVASLPYYGQGTSMYRALWHVLCSLSGLQQHDDIVQSWIVCLTDGISDSKSQLEFQQELERSDEKVHIITIGINLKPNYEQNLRILSKKYGVGDEKGFFFRSDGTTEGMDDAFAQVKSKIPVSQTFELDGKLSDDDCRGYMKRFLPNFVPSHDMITQSFWIKFLYRRVTVFDQNSSFNYNESHDELGSSLMQVMLSEVELLLGENLRRDWLDSNYTQLIYDFSDQSSPEFRLICTAPESLDDAARQRLSSLDLPGFHIPTKRDLDNRSTLDRFLSQALDIPLENGALSCIDECGFILTLDFAMKILCMHERVACRIPCLIEGETGVSKTALTKMYSILRNSSMTSKARGQTSTDLDDIAHVLESQGFHLSAGSISMERLRQTIEEEDDGASSEVANAILNLLREKIDNRPPIFVSQASASRHSTARDALATLEFFSESILEKTFWEVNVDSSLEEADFVSIFQDIRAVARKLRQSDATIVVFLDEINTSSVLGLLKEIVIDNNLAGETLEENLVVIAALNPPRKEIQLRGREQDLGREWASGHYQVSKMPESMNKLKWAFGSLTHSQEKDFIYRRIGALRKGPKTMSSFLQAALTEVVAESHEIIRRFAQRNIAQSLCRAQGQGEVLCMDDIEADAEARARSVVSLRDIQRVFAFFDFFLDDLSKDASSSWAENELERRAMLLAIAMVYYLRLDGQSRQEFLLTLESLPTETGQAPRFLDVLNDAMDTVIGGTDIPTGIATTRGLKENFFVTLVCSLSQTPLLLVGPPGSSKTLAVDLVDTNANGTDSHCKYYRDRPRLSLFHYQCSKMTSSKEVAAVFALAIQRQERIDKDKHRCVVFMDEAGLPESERESLKVLHYLLESHMSAKAKVGFVAVSNHVLDAAKTNRCVMLLRQDPDEKEMHAITTGVLFDKQVLDVDVDGTLLTSQDFAANLWKFYASLFAENSDLNHLVTFFGLRDYIYFLKAIRRASSLEGTRLQTSLQILVGALQRNFNGITQDELFQVACRFLCPFVTSAQALEMVFRPPMTILKDALRPSNKNLSELERPRFKLIIDCTEDDSILRLLKSGNIVAHLNKQSLFQLSNLPENAEIERIRLVSGVKFAALQGSFAVLSQTESINESFYDLFNQRFRVVRGRDGKETLYTNIAVGGISRRSLVRPEFECIVQVRESSLVDTPAPFLNRFEKYRLTLEDVLIAGWSRFGMMGIIEMARERTTRIARILQGHTNTFGWMERPDTITSIFLEALPYCDSRLWNDQLASSSAFASSSITLESILLDFLSQYTRIKEASKHIKFAIAAAKEVLSVDALDILEDLMSTESSNTEILSALQSIVSGDTTTEVASVVGVCTTLIQMVLTRAATFKLILLATPESIFKNRYFLPQEIVDEYLRQDHFSLKHALKRIVSGGSSPLTIIHTRSDQYVHAIPTLPADRSCSVEDLETVDAVLKCVSDDGPHHLAIENMSGLRSEASLRNSVSAWVEHKHRHTFLLLMDMSDKHALDRANFARMIVEQSLACDQEAKKRFVLLLYYSPSSSLKAQFYPALFLGGWQHIFLDSTGNDSLSFDTDQFIALACQGHDDSVATVRHSRMRESVQGLFSRILPHIASQNVFYPEQSSCQATDFYSRKVALKRLFENELDSKLGSISDILVDRFLAVWLGDALESTTKNAANALLQGTTQLSLTMSIHSTLVQSFQAFITAALAEANQWKNIDLIVHRSSPACIRELFGVCLQCLPTPPFEELVLQHKRSLNSRLLKLPPRFSCAPQPKFPFFVQISTFFDDLVDWVIEQHMKDGMGESSNMTAKECYEKVVHFLSSTKLSDETKLPTKERLGMVQAVQAFVSETSAEVSHDLSKRYHEQFVEFKLGCSASTAILTWLNNHLQDMPLLVGIHVLANVEQNELKKLVSAVTLMDSLNNNFDNGDVDVLVENESGSHNSLLAIVFECLEKEMIQQTTGDNGQHSRLGSAILRRPDAVHKSFPHLDGKVLSCRIRRLSMLLLWNKCRLYRIEDDTHPLYGTIDAAVSPDHFSLSTILECSGLETDHKRQLRDLMLGHFLSSRWRHATNYFLDSDLDFLLEQICDGQLRDWAAVRLLRIAGHDQEFENRTYCITDTVLIAINGRISCENLSSFSGESERECMPHFIPYWLQCRENAPSGHSTIRYFASYGHCFGGTLSTVMFNLALSDCASKAQNTSSEQLYLELQRDLNSELSLDRQLYTQISRLRTFGEGSELRGTPLAAISLSAQLLCFVGKVAYELATSQTSLVLNGTYRQEAANFLEELMCLKQARWQEFFIGVVLNERGEGTLATLFNNGGPLRGFDWCQLWIAGTSTSNEGALETLQISEAALGEAQLEETRKCRDLRLCPHCGQPFIVAAANCGQFTCGRDAHEIHGRPALNNTVINSTHGCGRAFSLTEAPMYQADETILAPLREKVAEGRSKVELCQSGRAKWDAARALHVPTLLHLVKVCREGGSFPPSSHLLSSSTIAEAERHGYSWELKLVEVLWEAKDLVPRLGLLPDLIELYMWLHDTFRYLLTRQEAFLMSMNNLMTESQLVKRFDKARVSYLLALWDRCRLGLNDTMMASNYEVQWECEAVQVPVNDVGNTTIVSLLSEGQMPNDGNDLLFLFINETIASYNGFSDKLTSLAPGEMNSTEDIDPKYLVRGLSGALKLETAFPLQQHEIKWTVESCWDPENESFDLKRLRDVLSLNTAFLEHLPPRIANPVSNLRERFCFRELDNTIETSISTHRTVARRGQLFFANRQDAVLWDELIMLLQSLDADRGDSYIRGVLIDCFHMLGYESLRGILEGTRNLFDLLLTNGKSDFESVASVLSELVEGNSMVDDESPLKALGFPSLLEKQEKMLETFDFFQTIELAKYAGEQLASEAYVFALLPLHVTEPLSEAQKVEMTKTLQELLARHEREAVLTQTEEFVGDVLSFYETQILEGANKTNDTIHSFLKQNNFCDESDPLFAAVSSSVTLRQYISLRQFLHQFKLSLLLETGETNDAAIGDQESEKARGPNPTLLKTQGKCWMWHEANCGSTSESITKVYQISQQGLRSKLWFDEALLRTQVDSQEAIEAVIDENDHDLKGSTNERIATLPESPPQNREFRAALLLQRWWRFHWSILSKMDVESDFSYEEDCMNIEAEENDENEYPSKINNQSETSSARGVDKMEIEATYGREQDEMEMRSWLDQNKIHQSTADCLVQLGAHCIEDVIMIATECQELLDDIPPLDKVKLKKAAERFLHKKEAMVDKS